MKCWLCQTEILVHNETKKFAKFCYHCGMPQGEQIEFASAIPGTGAATIKTADGEIYETTFRDYKRTTSEKIS